MPATTRALNQQTRDEATCSVAEAIADTLDSLAERNSRTCHAVTVDRFFYDSGGKVWHRAFPTSLQRQIGRAARQTNVTTAE
jgi:hypothetical protein